MDPHRIVEALQATLGALEAGQREGAEKLLLEMHKIIGFAPTLLQIVLEKSLDLSVRKAAAVFLKNMVIKSWRQRDSVPADEPVPFSIHENDKAAIRDVIVSAMASTDIPIQSILKVTVSKVLKYDFPSRLPNFVDQLLVYLKSMDFREFHGALLCTHGLVQVYEHKLNDKGPLPQTMATLLPLLYHRMSALVADTSDESLTLQKIILKIFYHYTDYYLPTSSLNGEWVTQWHALICSILVNSNGATNDADSVYWKRQKWAARILYCWFTSYGSPGNVQSKYASFAEWYLKSFSHQVLTTFLKICDAYRHQTYISPVVLTETISYFSAALSYSFCWKVLHPYFDTLLQDVIVPLLSFTPELAELWEDDPLEYIRYNTSMFMSGNSLVDAASSFIKEACSKRKGTLDKAMQYCTQLLNHDVKPEIKDGVLHLIGKVCIVLLKNKAYKEQLENFLTAHVLSLFEAPEGYRRARACWLVGKLSRVQFSNVELLNQTAMACRHLMCTDPDLPVRVSAATTVFTLIKDQDAVKKAMSVHLPELVLQLLKLLRETEFDDLNSVFRDILVYADELQPIAVQMLQHLSGIFLKLVGVQENGVGLVSSGDNEKNGDLELSEENDYQSIVATGVMENIETLVSVISDNEGLVANSEGVVVQLIQVILNNKISDFYNEAFSLICSFTCNKISPLLWTVYDWLYQAFLNDASDHFVSMATAIHNYLTIDPKAFVSSPERVRMFISMCGRALQDEEEQDSDGVYSAKLLEVLVFNFRGQLDGFIPEIIELAVTPLTKKTTGGELRIRCLVVVIAAITASTALVLSILSNHMWPETQTPIIENILKMWMENIQKFNGLHDKRICVFGLCTLLALGPDQRPPAVESLAERYLPSLLHVLTGLKEAYAAKKEMEKEDEDESDEDEIPGDSDQDTCDAVDSDCDVIDEEGNRYLELLEAVEAELGSDDDDDDTDDDDDDDDYEVESMIESYDTELDNEENEMDEYVTFYHLMTQMENSDAAWYQRLVSPLTESQKAEFKEIAKTATNCIAHKESKMIEKAGGYNFQQTDVPSSFNFSGDPPPQA